MAYNNDITKAMPLNKQVVNNLLMFTALSNFYMRVDVDYIYISIIK